MFTRTMLVYNVRGNNVRHFCSPGGGSDGGDPKFKGVEGPRDHSCGIPPWKPTFHVCPPHPPEEFPAHLIRPPCLPGSEQAPFRPCSGFKGYYCIPCRLKYKYPSFSENIDFIPPFVLHPPCWWKGPPSCYGPGDDESRILESITKRWPCNYD